MDLITQRPIKVLYMFPTDRPVRQDYLTAIDSAIRDVRTWFRSELLGRTFHIASIETIPLANTAEFYSVHSWTKVHSEIPAGLVGKNVVVAYADVKHACDAPGRLGAAIPNLTILPCQDMDGLIGAPYFDDCGKQYVHPSSRYVGGLGHELGHAFGLPHPPGCETGDPSCDKKSIMWFGYVDYPNTYLSNSERLALLNHPSFLTFHEVHFSTRAQWLFDAYPDGKFTMSDVKPNGPVPIDYSNREGEEWLLKVVNGQLRFFETKRVI